MIMELLVPDGESFLHIIQVLPGQPCDWCPLLVLYPLPFRNSKIAHLSFLCTPNSNAQGGQIWILPGAGVTGGLGQLPTHAVFSFQKMQMVRQKHAQPTVR